MADNNVDPQAEARFWRQKYQEQLQVINALMNENNSATAVLTALAQQVQQHAQTPATANDGSETQVADTVSVNGVEATK